MATILVIPKSAKKSLKRSQYIMKQSVVINWKMKKLQNHIKKIQPEILYEWGSGFFPQEQYF